MLQTLPFALNSSSELDEATLVEIRDIFRPIINADPNDETNVDPRDETFSLVKPSKYLPKTFLDSVFHSDMTYWSSDNVKLIFNPTTAINPKNPKISFFVVKEKIYNEEGVIVEKSDELLTIELNSGEITREQLNLNSVVIKTITASVSLDTVPNNIQHTNVLEVDEHNKIPVSFSDHNSTASDEDDMGPENSFESIELNSSEDLQDVNEELDLGFVLVSYDADEEVKDFELLELNQDNDLNSEDDSEESNNPLPPAYDLLREYFCRKIIANDEGDKNVFLVITRAELDDNLESIEVTTQLIMPYLVGQTLETYLIERHDKKPIKLDVIPYMLAIIRNLVKLHKMGIVDGDLRPSNIMLDEKDNKKIATIFDFDGSAILAKEIFKEIPNVFSKIAAKSPYFEPPEAYASKKTANFNIKGSTSYDIYSLGVIFALLLGWGHDHQGLQVSSLTLRRIYSPERPECLNSSEENRLSPYSQIVDFAENTYYIDINSFPDLDEKFQSIIEIKHGNEVKSVSIIESLLSLIRKMIGLVPEKRPDAKTIETTLVNIQEKIIKLGLADNETSSAEIKLYSKGSPFFNDKLKSKSLPNLGNCSKSPAQEPTTSYSPSPSCK